jgi:hypothetical protein
MAGRPPDDDDCRGSSAWSSSIVMLQAELIWPLASSVTWDMEILLPFTESVGSRRPGSGANTDRAA